jgi:DNA-binding IclR family transcriptional regulator
MHEKQMIIIELLRCHPEGLHGADIVRVTGGKIGRGTVYDHLAHLVREGMVKVEDEPMRPPLKARRRYRLPEAKVEAALS